MEIWCRGRDSNPHGAFAPEDFKSSVSAISPPRHWSPVLSILPAVCRACRGRVSFPRTLDYFRVAALIVH
jgi:hypothetical protein